jgi:hypothetical protein
MSYNIMNTRYLCSPSEVMTAAMAPGFPATGRFLGLKAVSDNPAHECGKVAARRQLRPRAMQPLPRSAQILIST